MSDWRPGPGTSKTTYEAIKDAIVGGDLPPGHHLTETGLARRLNTSRTPIRESLRRLEADGLVVKGSDGMEVRERSPDEILNIYELRVLLEAEAGRIAAERSSQVDLLRLERLVNRGFDLDPASAATDLVALNREFHRAVRRASHNGPLIDVCERLDLHLARYPEITLKYPGRWAQAVQEHAELVEAIRQRDPATAAKIGRTHFEAARDIRIQLWESEL